MYSYAFFKTINQEIILPVGIQGELKILKAGNLSALVEPKLALNDVKKSDDILLKAVLNHDRIIRELFTKINLLPLRFGTYFNSEQELLTYLDTNCQEYLQKLNFLENKAEFTLKLISKELNTDNITTKNLKGREYFLAKKQFYQIQLDYQNRQNEELEIILASFQNNNINYLFPDEQREKIYLLLTDQELMTTEKLITELGKKINTWDLELGEKLPPYHFI